MLSQQTVNLYVLDVNFVTILMAMLDRVCAIRMLCIHMVLIV